MELVNLVRAAIFCAMAIAMGYSLMMIPNIELITVIIFLSGVTLNLWWGALVGLVAMGIYSGLNPLGSGLSFPPLFFAHPVNITRRRTWRGPPAFFRMPACRLDLV